ncbi:TIGR03915 family putative DNA repair protein [Maribellus maritimus]|uniref:TIGR03915 family putative DNA repair protein n=1 Tax=Maribellus maritimus TaxID=2870838 RepID=UPI001EEBCD43|nr:TIGR03915 family putative DNA repair protein [Maribellus maritimus]MCG6185929.1 TIGR03915 family putative DNA repair protein [Maribellus maritimus]
MQIYSYDGTFEGLLTAVFECYSRKDFPEDIVSQKNEQKNLFAERFEVLSDAAKADRVWSGAQKKLSKRNNQMLFYAFLSEEPGIEMKILRFFQRLFLEKHPIETDYSDSDVLSLSQLSQKVLKEAEQIRQFVRFQHTRDGLYFCGIDPRYDVIPLTVEHFRNRFADQSWLLYDLKRSYGVLFHEEKLEEVEISQKEFHSLTGKVNQDVLEEEEELYQTLWKSYFKNINIKERKNLRLQRQHMPRRFWKYLPEINNKS